jgi:DNA-directed RNA polymerase specialized sigma24 family protein
LTQQVYVCTGDLGTAQDLVQEAFCRALSRWSKVPTYDDLVAWIRRVALTLANSRWRRAKVAGRAIGSALAGRVKANLVSLDDVIRAVQAVPKAAA